MYSMPVRTVCTFFTSPEMQWPAYMLPSVESSQPGHDHRQVVLGRGDHPGVLRVDLVGLRQHAAEEDLVHELVREQRRPLAVVLHPPVQHRGLDPPHRLVLGNARVGDAIQVPIEQRLFVGRREVAIVRHPHVVIVRHEVEDVFLEVGAGAADAGHLVLPDHLGERAPEFGRAHRAGERHEHRAAGVEVGAVGIGRVLEGRGVEVAVVTIDELRNRSGHERREVDLESRRLSEALEAP